jgi:hypothetical protein
MKNTIKLLGIAIAVLLTFGLFGCDGDPGESNEAPKVTISSDDAEGAGTSASPWVLSGTGIVLTAEYEGTDLTGITYKWQYQAAAGEAWTDVGTGASTYKATEPGAYRVTVTVGDLVSNSPAVYVKEAEDDDPQSDFYGTWKLNLDHTLSDNTPGANRTGLVQTIVISKDKFELTEPSPSPDKLSLTIAVDGWAVKQNAGFTVVTNAGYTATYAQFQAAFPSGYELTGTISADSSAYADTGANKKFSVFINGDKTAIVRTGATTGTLTRVITCVYEKEEAAAAE